MLPLTYLSEEKVGVSVITSTGISGLQDNDCRILGLQNSSQALTKSFAVFGEQLQGDLVFTQGERRPERKNVVS